MPKKTSKKTDKNKKYEKPVSLYPLSLKEALQGAMGVEPPKKEKKKKAKD